MCEIEYDNLPQYVKDVLDTYDDNSSATQEALRIQKELEKIGWTCDYDFCGYIFDVEQIKK